MFGNRCVFLLCVFLFSFYSWGWPVFDLTPIYTDVVVLMQAAKEAILLNTLAVLMLVFLSLDQYFVYLILALDSKFLENAVDALADYLYEKRRKLILQTNEQFNANVLNIKSHTNKSNNNASTGTGSTGTGSTGTGSTGTGSTSTGSTGTGSTGTGSTGTGSTSTGSTSTGSTSTGSTSTGSTSTGSTSTGSTSTGSTSTGSYIFKYKQRLTLKILHFLARLSYFINEWILSTNHRKIAIMYFYFVALAGFTGLSLATIIRLELAYPGQFFLTNNAERYLTIISLHGVVMVFFMIIPVIFGAFGNFLLPTQLGIRDVAFPRLNSFMFWVTPAGFVMLLHIIMFDKSYQLTYWINYTELKAQLRRRYSMPTSELARYHESAQSSLLAWRLANMSKVDITARNLEIKESAPHLADTGIFSFEIKNITASIESGIKTLQYHSFDAYDFAANALSFCRAYVVSFTPHQIVVIAINLLKNVINSLNSKFGFFIKEILLLSCQFRADYTAQFILSYVYCVFNRIKWIPYNLDEALHWLWVYWALFPKTLCNVIITSNYAFSLLKVFSLDFAFLFSHIVNFTSTNVLVAVVHNWLIVVAKQLNLYNRLFSHIKASDTELRINSDFSITDLNALNAAATTLPKFNVYTTIQRFNGFNAPTNTRNTQLNFVVELQTHVTNKLQAIVYNFDSERNLHANYTPGTFKLSSLGDLHSNMWFVRSNSVINRVYNYSISSVFKKPNPRAIKGFNWFSNPVLTFLSDFCLFDVLVYRNRANFLMTQSAFLPSMLKETIEPDAQKQVMRVWSVIAKNGTFISDAWFAYNQTSATYLLIHVFVNYLTEVIKLLRSLIVNTLTPYIISFIKFLNNNNLYSTQLHVTQAVIMFFCWINAQLLNPQPRTSIVSNTNVVWPSEIIAKTTASHGMWAVDSLTGLLWPLTNARKQPKFTDLALSKLKPLYKTNNDSFLIGDMREFYLNTAVSNYSLPSVASSATLRHQILTLTRDYCHALWRLDYINDWRQLKLEREIWRSVDSLNAARHHLMFRKKYYSNFYEPSSMLNKVSTWLPNHLLPGWAFVTPYSSRLRYTALGKVDVALIVVFAASLGSVFSSVNYVITYRYIGAPTLKNRRELRSFFVDALLVASKMMIVANPALLIGILLLLSDRHFNTSVFDFSGGGDTILFQHLFWFFGHPEVYIIIIPCFGIMNSLLPYYLRKRLSGRLSLQFSMYTIAFMSFAVWGHHMYMVGLANSVRTLYSTMTVMISVPASTKVIHWCVTLIQSTLSCDVGFLFLMAFMYFFVLGGLSGMFVAHIGFDTIFHDTFYVIGHFHVMLAGSAVSCVFAAFYFYFPAIFGVRYSKFFAYLHFIFYLCGQLLTLIPMFWLGYAGMPRRIMDYPSSFGGWHSIISSGHLLTLISFGFFLLMLCDSFYEGRAPITKTKGVSRLNTRLAFLLYESRKLQSYNTKSLLLVRKPNATRSARGDLYRFCWHSEMSNFEYTFICKPTKPKSNKKQ